eukprot:scaffold43233_cov183-Amphora_coffeaeformis.AAC.1
MEQSGSCDTAFDTQLPVSTFADVDRFLFTCPQFIDPLGTCCCLCDNNSTSLVSTFDFASLLNETTLILSGYQVREVLESQVLPDTSVCTIANDVDGEIFIDIPYDLFTDQDVEDFLGAFIQSYNQLAFETCFFNEIVGMAPVDDGGRRLERIRTGRTRFTYTSVCYPNVCPPDNDFPPFLTYGGFRMLTQTASVVTVRTDASSAPEWLHDGRQLQTQGSFLDQCACPPNSVPTTIPPSETLLVERFNVALDEVGLLPIENIDPAFTEAPNPPPSAPPVPPPTTPKGKGKGKGYYYYKGYESQHRYRRRSSMKSSMTSMRMSKKNSKTTVKQVSSNMGSVYSRIRNYRRHKSKSAKRSTKGMMKKGSRKGMMKKKDSSKGMINAFWMMPGSTSRKYRSRVGNGANKYNEKIQWNGWMM